MLRRSSYPSGLRRGGERFWLQVQQFAYALNHMPFVTIEAAVSSSDGLAGFQESSRKAAPTRHASDGGLRLRCARLGMAIESLAECVDALDDFLDAEQRDRGHQVHPLDHPLAFVA